MRECPTEEELFNLRAGQASPGRSAELRAHIQECPRCAAWWQEADADDAIFAGVQDAWKAHAAGIAAPATFPLPGRTIGPYQLLERIDGNAGGMGEVWKAEQQAPIRRIVALKLIKPGLETREVIARFEVERQALAQMNHRHVAVVHDAGMTAQGRPYFVMEYVDGRRITTYCDEHRLTVADRLGLFIEVCAAIQHAHQKGIIHRDIKPSNVLVTVSDGRPMPKVIDFGIAKAVDQRQTGRTLVTGEGQIVGTPEYMSPEQADPSAADIDTRTDVYSLGVLLYELLVGAKPFDREALREQGCTDLLRVVREVDPPRPSTRLSRLSNRRAELGRARQVDPRLLLRQLRGDLDWIVMMAMHKDRTRRYASASELAADVQRYLRHEPVIARPPSIIYRAARFVRKHRAGVTVAASFVLLLAGALALTTTLYVQAERERSRADWSGYVAGIQAADGALRLSDPVQARLRLDAVPDRLKKNWEWCYLNGLLDQSIAVLPTDQGNVHAVAFIPGTESLVSTGFDGTVRVWDSRTGEELRRLEPGHTGRANCLAVSASGTVVATGGGDGTVRMWDPRSGAAIGRPLKIPEIEEELHDLRPAQSVDSVALSPDGTIVAAGYSSGEPDNGFVAAWNTVTGAPRFEPWAVHQWPVHAIAFSADGREIVTASEDHSVAILDSATGAELRRLRGASKLQSLAVHPDGRWIATGGKDNAIRLWDTVGGEGPRLLGYHRQTPMSLVFSPDGQLLASGSGDKLIKLWDVDSGQERASLHGHTAKVNCVAFSRNGALLASAADDGTLRIWRPQPHEPSVVLTSPANPIGANHGDEDAVHALAFNSNGSQLAVGFRNHTIELWDVTAGRKCTLSVDDQVQGLGFVPGRGRIVAGLKNQSICWCSVEPSLSVETTLAARPCGPADGRDDRKPAAPGEVALGSDRQPADNRSDSKPGSDEREPAVSGGPGAGPTQEKPPDLGGLALSPDGRWAATTDVNSVHLFDLREQPGVQTSTLVRPGGTPDRPTVISAITFSPNGAHLAAVVNDGTLTLWDLATPDAPRSWEAHLNSDGASCVAFHPAGTLLATGSADRTVRLWETRSGRPLAKLCGHSDVVMSIAFSPDGSRLAAGSADGSIKLWDTTSGGSIELWGTLTDGSVKPHDKTSGGSIELWDTITGDELLTLLGHKAPVKALAFSPPDGRTLASGDAAGVVRLWETERRPVDLTELLCDLGSE